MGLWRHRPSGLMKGLVSVILLVWILPGWGGTSLSSDIANGWGVFLSGLLYYYSV